MRLLLCSSLVHTFENFIANRPVYHWYFPSRILRPLTDDKTYITSCDGHHYLSTVCASSSVHFVVVIVVFFVILTTLSLHLNCSMEIYLDNVDPTLCSFHHQNSILHCVYPALENVFISRKFDPFYLFIFSWAAFAYKLANIFCIELNL